MNTVFFGSSEYVLPILEVLSDKFGLSLIITTDKDGPVIEFARKNNITYVSTQKLTDSEFETISQTQADLGITADFGIIIPAIFLDIFPRGILNIHPSLLPAYRGPTPVQTALINGDRETGVTIFKLDEKIDHGPILAQEEYEIEPSDNGQTLLINLFKISAYLLDKTLVDYLEEVLIPQDQEDNLATFTKMLTKQDGFINLQKPVGKDKLENMIRAFYPWPGVWTKAEINGKEVTIKLLPDQMVQVEGKKPQSFKDFSNGYKEGEKILSKLRLT